MRFTNLLEDVLGQKPKIKLLRYLLSSRLELTGRELARATGIHHRTVHNSLKELASLGIVIMRQAGKAIIYKINDNNIIVDKILKPIFGLERDLLSRTVTALIKKTKLRVVSAIVFGSVASSSERGTSDVDVLFLVSSKKEQGRLIEALEKAGYDFLLKYGNILSPLVFTLDEFNKRLKQKNKLALNIIQNGLAVYGKTIQEVLVECQRKE